VVGALSACEDGQVVGPVDNSRQGVAAEGGRLVADALASALLDLAEALRADRARRPEAPPPEPGVTDAGSAGPGTSRSLASLPSRAVADAASAVAAILVPAVVDRFDVNALLAKVDVQALVSRVDVDSLLESVDLERLLDRVDVDELVQQVDMGAVAREALEGIDVGDIIQDSTASIASDTLEAVRIQAMRADALVARIVDRVLGRRRPRDTALAKPAGGP
jgi:hypothetical protein